jgi:hypothetical protein
MTQTSKTTADIIEISFARFVYQQTRLNELLNIKYHTHTHTHSQTTKNNVPRVQYIDSGLIIQTICCPNQRTNRQTYRDSHVGTHCRTNQPNSDSESHPNSDSVGCPECGGNKLTDYSTVQSTYSCPNVCSIADTDCSSFTGSVSFTDGETFQSAYNEADQQPNRDANYCITNN